MADSQLINVKPVSLSLSVMYVMPVCFTAHAFMIQMLYQGDKQYVEGWYSIPVSSGRVRLTQFVSR